MASEEKKRIISFAEAAAPQSGDYLAIDSQPNGTRKLSVAVLATQQDIEAEQTAREEADDALTESVTALSDEVTAQVALIQNPTKTVSGEVAHFTDGADMPAKSVIVNIEPKQSGTGTPSPDNVRAISGWESVKTSVVGKNLLPTRTDGWSGSSNGVSVKYNSDGSVTLNGTATATTIYNLISNTATENRLYLPQGEYNISGEDVENNNFWIGILPNAESGAWGAYTKGTKTFAVNDGEYVFPRIRIGSGITLNNVTIHPQIELGTSATAYEPYTGATATVNLGRTVYGGTLDVVSGVLTVNKGVVIANGSENWVLRSSGTATTVFQFANATTLAPTQTGEICSHFEFNSQAHVASESRTNTFVLGTSKTLYFQVANSIATAVSEFKTWLAQNPVTVVFDIATPQTYTLTGQEISTLLGENNVWADAGAVDVTYRRDINLALEQLEALLNS